MLIINSE